MTAPPPRTLITINDAAARLDVSTKTIRRWIIIGKLPAQRVGGKLIRLDLADVDALAQPLAAVKTPKPSERTQ